MCYTVVTGWKLSEFEAEVREYLELGWTLVGGVAMTLSAGNETTYAQALMKKV